MSAPKTSKKPFILIAEDDEDDFIFLEEMLKKQYPSLAIEWAKDGEELLEFLNRPGMEKPKLLLLDLNMPRRDGRETLTDIRENAAFSDLKIVVLTTSGSEIDRNFVQGFKNTLFVTKPVGYPKYLHFVKSLEKELR